MDNKMTYIIKYEIPLMASKNEIFLNKILTLEQHQSHKHLINNWKQGMIIFCDNSGNFTDSIDISNIKAIN
jgi:hypothetical protein